MDGDHGAVIVKKPGKVNHDVNLIVSNLPRDFRVREAIDGSPVIRMVYEFFSNMIGLNYVGITEDFELVVIVIAQ